MSAEEAAEVVAAKATEELRANGLAFMEQESSTLHTLEEFRQAFNGANGPAFDSDDEQGGDADDKKRKRVRPNNPDAELIERATEEQVRILNIDCRGTEGKKQRRRIRNRMSAQLHRERKKLYIDALEAFVKIKEGRIGALERDVMQLAKENERLRGTGAQGMPPMSMSAVHSVSSASASASASGNGSGKGKEKEKEENGSSDSDSSSELTGDDSSLHEGVEIDTAALTMDGISDDERSPLSALLPSAEETQQQHD